jgi:hypothetical protein
MRKRGIHAPLLVMGIAPPAIVAGSATPAASCRPRADRLQPPPWSTPTASPSTSRRVQPAASRHPWRAQGLLAGVHAGEARPNYPAGPLNTCLAGDEGDRSLFLTTTNQQPTNHLQTVWRELFP